MHQALNTPELIVTDALQSAARQVVDVTRRSTPFPYLIDAKLGNAENAPMLDADTAEQNDTPLYTIAIKWKDIAHDLIQADTQRGGPLCQIARRANDVIARAAILNRHNRRPPLYAETTVREFIRLGFSTPQHSPLIRAAGHVTPPPVFPLNHDLGPIITDIAAHMAASQETQSVAQILHSPKERQDLLDKWPHLELALFIRRVAGIQPNKQGCYRPDQSWGNHLSPQRLVTSTVLRILTRDQRPHTTDYLTVEVQRLVGKFLPDAYNTLSAVRATLSQSDNISWQGRSTFGLETWDTALERQNMASTRGRTGDLIYALLTQRGLTDVETVIEHVQRRANAKRRTVQEAINHDPEDRFVRISNRRVAANPIPKAHNPGAAPFTVIPDEQIHQPAPVLHEAEFRWLVDYVQALNDLAPPLPTRAAVTGSRAAGFALDDPMEMVVVVNDDDRSSLEPRLAEIAVAASETVPSVQPRINIVSPRAWERQQADKAPVAHHNVWLASHEAA